MFQLHIHEGNKHWVVILAILGQLALGAIYAWSVFTPDLVAIGGAYEFTAQQAAWIFSVGLATFAVVMVGAGKLLPKVGPGPLMLTSAMVLGAGYILGGLYGDTFIEQLFYIGFVGGAGIGIGYVVPIATAVRWYPGKEGFVSGLAVAGFGFGALIWVKVAGSWFGLLDNTALQEALGLPGVQSVFVVYGIAFFILAALSSLGMVNPVLQSTKNGAPLVDEPSMVSSEMLRTRQFYMLWSVFLFSALAGLMVIYSMKLFGIDVLRFQGFAEVLASATAGTAMATYAVLNGLGRIAWGLLSDKIGRRYAIALMVGLQGFTMLATYHVFVEFGQDFGLIIAAGIIGFNFGGNFALMPAMTGDLFGKKTLGSNYPWIFLAYGVAGIAGPLLAGFFKDGSRHTAEIITWMNLNLPESMSGFTQWVAIHLGGPFLWMVPFIIAGVACILGAIIALRIKPVDMEVYTRQRRGVALADA